MNLDEFKTQVARQGLARTNRWITRVYPPRGLSSTNRAISDILSRGRNRLDVNIPGLDLIDTFTDAINNASIDVGGINVSHNFNLPTLGYALSNMGTRAQAINLFCSNCILPEVNTQNFNWTEFGEERKLGYTNTYGDATFSYYCSEDLRERKFFEDWNSLVYNHRNKRYGYYNDYVSTIEFIQYTAGWEKQIAVYKFNEAYPSTIGSMEFNYESGNILKLDVAFKYKNYERIA